METLRLLPFAILLAACAGPAASPAGPPAASATASATAAEPASGGSGTAPPSTALSAEGARWKVLKMGTECRVVIAAAMTGGCIGGSPCGPSTRPIACFPGVDHYPADVERPAGAKECSVGTVKVPCPDLTP